MNNTKKIKDNHTNEKLTIKVVSNDNLCIPEDLRQKLLNPRRLTVYFLVLIVKGSVTYNLDMQEFTVNTGQLLFATPNQVFIPPANDHELKYFKILFDENMLSLLPQQFPFLVNPLNNQVISFEPEARSRVGHVFEILNKILYLLDEPTDFEITLSYFNTLLSELNSAYFKDNNSKPILNTNLSKFIEFKLIVETNLAEQPSIHDIANRLALSTNSLYRSVKEFSGTSPKDFFTNRLLIEAQRKLQFSNLSVKELAFELGFNDPDYFSRFFKKCTGQSIRAFLDAQQDSSRQ